MHMIAELAATVSLHCTFTKTGQPGEHEGRIYVDYDRRYAYLDMQHEQLGQLETRRVLVTETHIEFVDGFFAGFNRIYKAEVNRSTGELFISVRGIRDSHVFRGNCEPGDPIVPPQAPPARF